MIFTYQKKLQGKSVGIVFGSFSPLHQGHLDLIMRAKKENDGGCLVIVCGYEGDKGGLLMPHKNRYRYVREFFADDDLVAVYPINDSEIGIANCPNGWEGWLKEFERIWALAVDKSCQQRVWYVGEQDYYDGLTVRNERAVLIDRKENFISGTMIRKAPLRYWDKIAYPFRRVFSKNILVCGTASEGKTTLVKDLGKYFNAPYSWEYARDYMEEHSISEWEFDEIDYMAFLDGQYRLNKKLINSRENRGVFFADTDSMVTRMYAEFYTKDKDLNLSWEQFLNIAQTADVITSKCRWDKIYLLSPQGAFVDDNTRYMGHSGMKERREMFEILCENIKRSGNWGKVTILDGGYWKNFERIVSDVKRMIEDEKD